MIPFSCTLKVIGYMKIWFSVISEASLLFSTACLSMNMLSGPLGYLLLLPFPPSSCLLPGFLIVFLKNSLRSQVLEGVFFACPQPLFVVLPLSSYNMIMFPDSYAIISLLLFFSHSPAGHLKTSVMCFISWFQTLTMPMPSKY